MDVPLGIYIFMRTERVGEVGRKLDGSWTEIDFSVLTRYIWQWEDFFFAGNLFRCADRDSRGFQCIACLAIYSLV